MNDLSHKNEALFAGVLAVVSLCALLAAGGRTPIVALAISAGLITIVGTLAALRAFRSTPVFSVVSLTCIVALGLAGISQNIPVGCGECSKTPADGTAGPAVADVQEFPDAGAKGVLPSSAAGDWRIDLNDAIAQAEQLLAQGDFSASVQMFLRAIALLDRYDHKDLQGRDKLVDRLMEPYEALNQLDQAIEKINEHVERLTADARISPTRIAEWREQAGRILGSQKRLEDAIAQFEMAIAIRKQEGTQPDKLAFSQVNLAKSLHLAKRDAEAKVVVDEAISRLAQHTPPEHPARGAAAALAKEIDQSF